MEDDVAEGLGLLRVRWDPNYGDGCWDKVWKGEEGFDDAKPPFDGWRDAPAPK